MAKTNLPLVFQGKKKSFTGTQPCPMVSIVYTCVRITAAEVNSCDRNRVTHVPKIFLVWSFTENIYTHTQPCARAHLLCHVLLFAAPCTEAHQAPLSMGFSRQEHRSGRACPSPGDLSRPGIKPRSVALQADSLLSEPSLLLTFICWRNQTLCPTKSPHFGYSWVYAHCTVLHDHNALFLIRVGL